MICIGIDVSKGKSTVCMIKPYGEIIFKPFEIEHTISGLSVLVNMIKNLNEDSRVVMESTGIYHFPVLQTLQKNGIFVSVINPYRMKRFRCQSIRQVKTDKLDAIAIANFGIANWFSLKNNVSNVSFYSELKSLMQFYRNLMENHIKSLLELTYLLDQTMPGIKDLFNSFNEKNGKNKLADIASTFCHYDNITKYSESEFILIYNKWCKEKGYYSSNSKAIKLYELAKNNIPTLPSTTTSTTMLVKEACRVLTEIDATLFKILSQMQNIARNIPEYNIVRKMAGVGDILSVKLIAEIGDINRFHSAKALVAYAGIDSPPFQSGQYNAPKHSISKRGSSSLRKVGYETMMSLKAHDYCGDAVYDFIIKKESEGKPKKVAKIAGLNKFLRIYYARIKENYNNK